MKKYLLLTKDELDEKGTIYRVTEFEELTQAYGNLVKIGVSNGYIVKVLNPKVVEHD